MKSYREANLLAKKAKEGVIEQRPLGRTHKRRKERNWWVAVEHHWGTEKNPWHSVWVHWFEKEEDARRYLEREERIRGGLRATWSMGSKETPPPKEPVEK